MNPALEWTPPLVVISGMFSLASPEKDAALSSLLTGKWLPATSVHLYYKIALATPDNTMDLVI
jgi:hypothetical protein